MRVGMLRYVYATPPPPVPDWEVVVLTFWPMMILINAKITALIGALRFPVGRCHPMFGDLNVHLYADAAVSFEVGWVSCLERPAFRTET